MVKEESRIEVGREGRDKLGEEISITFQSSKIVVLVASSPA